MNVLHIIGYALLASPFVAIAVMSMYMVGPIQTIIIFMITALVACIIMAGAYMVSS